MAMEGSGYSERGSYDGGSYDGGSYAGRRGARRDSMGRYSREGGSYRGSYARDGYARDEGYSRHGDRNEMIENLRSMMDEAPDENTRREIQRLISKMEQE